VKLSLIPKADVGPFKIEMWRDRRRERIDVGAERMFAFRWFCFPAFEEPAFDYPAAGIRRPVRKFAAYCGAPMGIRCHCGSQLAGHDFGDEDSRCP